ncbi:MAG: HYR domain-containing protein, partial [Flavobacteriaceae bacterium]|nr:HYR domain-containing protein [Flavobacteriaceae bacterium]
CVEDTNVALLATVTRAPSCTGTFMYFFNWKKDGSDVRNFLADFGVLDDQITQTEPGGNPLTAGLYEVNITESWVGGTPTFSDSFLLEVQDVTAPVINCPSNITVSNDAGLCGANVTYSNATATDDCAFSIAQTSGLPTGSVFPIGTSSVGFTATDGAGNSSSCTFTITVQDNEDPELTCPSNINISTDPGSCEAVVIFSTPTATDNCSATTVQTSGLPSGSSFPLGSSTVQFTATDPAGNTAVCSFNIIVSDGENPELTCPANQEVLLTGNTYVLPDFVVSGDVTATDNCTSPVDNISQTPTPGTELTAGVYTISFMAIDDAGNDAECSFELSVVDDLGITSEDLFEAVEILNPFDNQLVLKILEEIQIDRIRLLSLDARLIIEWKKQGLSDEIRLDIPNLARGNYVLELGNSKKVAYRILSRR